MLDCMACIERHGYCPAKPGEGCPTAAYEESALHALRAFQEEERVIRQHNLLSTATDNERTETIARLIRWWNKHAAPILTAIDLEALEQKYDHYDDEKGGDTQC